MARSRARGPAARRRGYGAATGDGRHGRDDGAHRLRISVSRPRSVRRPMKIAQLNAATGLDLRAPSTRERASRRTSTATSTTTHPTRATPNVSDWPSSSPLASSPTMPQSTTSSSPACTRRSPTPRSSISPCASRRTSGWAGPWPCSRSRSTSNSTSEVQEAGTAWKVRSTARAAALCAGSCRSSERTMPTCYFRSRRKESA